MRPTQALASTLVAALVGVCLPVVATAQPITITGYFDRTSADQPDVIDQIQISTDGKTHRPFGITHTQSQVGVGGTDVFKRSLNPVVLLRGQKGMIAELDAATPVQRVKIIGVLMFSNMEILLNGVDVAPRPPTSGTGDPAR